MGSNDYGGPGREQVTEVVSDELLLRSLLSVHEDYHDPESARYVTEAIGAVDHEVCALTVTAAIDRASWAMKRANARTARWFQ